MYEENLNEFIKKNLNVKSIKNYFLYLESIDKSSLGSLLNSVTEAKLFNHARKFLNETKKRDIFNCCLDYSLGNGRIFLDISRNYDGTYLGNFYKNELKKEVRVLSIEGIVLR